MSREGEAYSLTAVQHRQSLWSEQSSSQRYPPLNRDLEADVAVIGGGITGLSTAWQLASAGRRVVVLEAYRIGAGSTGFSTGNLYAPVGTRLHSLGSKHGPTLLREVVRARSAAVDAIESLAREQDIDCDFRRVPFHIFTTDGQASDLEDLGKEIDAAMQAGLQVTESAAADFPWRPSRLLRVPDQAYFNPMRYLQGLAAACAASGHCELYEASRVVELREGEPCEILTQGGRVRAAQVIMATHSPKGVYGVHTAMQAMREYGIAARLDGELPRPGSYWHLQGGKQYSLRPYRRGEQAWLVLVGAGHKVGEKSDNESCFASLEAYLREHFAVREISHRWSAMSFKSADGLPYVGASPLQENVQIATGFATDGLTYGSLAGQLMADNLLGREHPLAKAFSPRRFTPAASAKNVAKETFTVTRHLLKDYLSYGEVHDLRDIPPGEGRTSQVDGEHVAAYRDEGGALKVVSAVCTHMGCLVHWNSAQKSWDCPCHGSRFSTDGEVLEGPALSPLARPKQSAD